MAEPVATYSICACDLDVRPMGRRDAVEVPRRRVGRPVGGAARRRDRDPVVRESPLRPGRPRAPARRALRRRGARAAHRRGRGSRAAPARRRRRRGPRRDVHRRRSATPGRAAERGGLRGTGEHPRLRGHRRRARRDVRGDGRRSLAERLLDCLDAAEAAGGDSRGRQSAALLVVERDGGLREPLGHARRPARRRPLRPARRAASHLRAPRRAVRLDAARGVDRRRRRAPRRARRAPRARRAS